jgi:hypothetical protein
MSEHIFEEHPATTTRKIIVNYAAVHKRKATNCGDFLLLLRYGCIIDFCG